MMSAIAEMHGIFALNGSAKNYPGGLDAYVKFLKEVARVRWVLVHTRDQDRDVLLTLAAAGLRIIMRVGEGGIVNVSDVHAAIDKGGGLVDVLQIGNEPYPPDNYPRGGPEGFWWDHAWYMNAIIDQCALALRDAGIRACTPAWHNPKPTDKYIGPPDPHAPQGTWMFAVRAAYNRYPYIGFHAYDAAALVNPDPHGPQPVLNRLDSWMMVFPQPFIISEQGIAYKYPGDAKTKEAGDMVKAARTFDWLHALAARKRVLAGCTYISPGATKNNESFGNDIYSYDPAGQNSYVWTDQAWAKLGELVERSALSAG